MKSCVTFNGSLLYLIAIILAVSSISTTTSFHLPSSSSSSSSNYKILEYTNRRTIIPVVASSSSRLLRHTQSSSSLKPSDADDDVDVDDEELLVANTELKMAMARHTILSIAAAVMCVPAECFTTPPMIEPNSPSSASGRAHRKLVSAALAKGWNTNLFDDDDTAPPLIADTTDTTTAAAADGRLVDDAMNSNDTDHKPSTYGEVTELGTRQLFHYMNMIPYLQNKECTSIQFVDLGSGNGKLVVQAYMEVPALSLARGIELSPSRSAVAKRAWEVIKGEAAAIRASGNNDKRCDDDDAMIRDGKPRRQQQPNLPYDDTKVEFHEGDLFELDISQTTHIYVASLCFTDDMMERLVRKINDEAHCLQCVATLKQFPTTVPYPSSSSLQSPNSRLFSGDKVRREFVEMSWTKPRGQGCAVYFYDIKCITGMVDVIPNG